MDFSKIEIEGATRAEAPKAVSAVHVELHQFKIGGVPLEVDIMPQVGQAWEAQRKAWRMKWRKTVNLVTGSKDNPDLDDAELVEMSDLEDEASREYFARAVVGWNIMDGKAEVKVTLENRCNMLKTFPEVFVAVVGKINEINRAAGNSETG